MNTIVIKTPEEIEMMRQAGGKAAEVLRIVCDAVKPGVTTKSQVLSSTTWAIRRRHAFR